MKLKENAAKRGMRSAEGGVGKPDLKRAVPEAGAPGGELACQFAEIEALLGKLLGEAEGWKCAAGGCLHDLLAGWVGPNYLSALHGELAGGADASSKFEMLRLAMGEAARAQRTGVWAGRLLLDQQKFEWVKEQAKAQSQAGAEGGKRPDYMRPLTDEERRAVVDKVDRILGLKK